MLPSHKTKYSLQSLLKLLPPPIMWVNSCASRGLQIQSTDRLMQAAWDTQGFLLLQKDCSLGFLLTAEALGQLGGTVYFIRRAPCALGSLHVENINPFQIPFLFFLPTLTWSSYFGIRPPVSGLTMFYSVFYYSSKRKKKVMCFCHLEREKKFFLQIADPVIILKYLGPQQCF